MMETAALIVAILALIGLFVALRRMSGLQERLDRTASQMAELRSTFSNAQESFEYRLNDMRLQARHQAGEKIFDPAMTIAEALSVHPKVGEVLTAFHLGGCSQCAVSDVDTIQGACQTYGIDQYALMNALNELVTGKPAGGSPGSAKTSNVQVSF